MNQFETALENVGITQPYSMDAEQAVLGTAIIDPDSTSRIMELVKPEYFYSRQNRGIFEQISRLFLANIPSDYITVVNAVSLAGIFNSDNDAKVYIASIAETVPSISNLDYYINILKENHVKRQLMGVAQSILKEVGATQDVDLLIEGAEQRIYDLRQGKDVRTLRPIAAAASESFKRLHDLSGPDREKYLGVPTGYSYLDYKLGKMGKSDLIIIAARPGMGKTSFALNIATNVAMYQKIPVAIFSLEMSSTQLTDRLLSSYAGVSNQSLRTGEIEEWDAITGALDRIASMPIYVDDTPDITVADMKRKIRRLNREPGTGNVGLIVVDYIQLMSSGKRNENRVQEISDITRNLKIMAKEFDVPVIALSQLSRSAEKRTGSSGRPQLSDLRDSGSIEQDADSVMFLYREAYYKKDEARDQTSAECIIAKNRHGETGTVNLAWDGAHTRFYDLDYQHNER